MVVSVRDIHIAYRSEGTNVVAVRGSSFDVNVHETLALVGESGSGKTTLAMSLLQLPREACATKGTVEFRRADGSAVSVLELRGEALRRYRWRDCAIVFQAAQNALNPVIPIEQQFRDTLTAHAGARNQKRSESISREMLEFVQLDPSRVLRSFPHQLSGGQRQRVMIALALCLNPRVLILDEPTTGLDVITQRAIIGLLRNIKDQYGVSIIFITHDLALAAELGDRVAIMYAGRIVESAPVEDIFYRPAHPYSLALLDSAPGLGVPPDEVHSIPGSPPDLRQLPAGCAFHERCPFATERCRIEDPPALEVGPRHTAACWNSSSVTAGTRARVGSPHS